MTFLQHNFFKKFIPFIILNWISITGYTSGKVPVMVGGSTEIDACGSLGAVHGLPGKPNSFLAVRSGPDTKYTLIDRLYNGAQVYFCDTQGEWIGIVYQTSTQDCGVSSPLPKSQSYKGPCKSGWAHRKWLTVTAG